MSDENISYTIDDNFKNVNNTDMCVDVDEYSNQYLINLDQDIVLANQINYQENYTVKELNLIIDYYGLKRRKLKKADLVEMISQFEGSIDNLEIVQERIRLWDNITELKENPFFKKYILFNV